jgi:hypothetical protein
MIMFPTPTGAPDRRFLMFTVRSRSLNQRSGSDGCWTHYRRVDHGLVRDHVCGVLPNVGGNDLTQLAENGSDAILSSPYPRRLGRRTVVIVSLKIVVGADWITT